MQRYVVLWLQLLLISLDGTDSWRTSTLPLVDQGGNRGPEHRGGAAPENEPSHYANVQAFRDFCRGHRPLAILPSSIELERIKSWKRDALALYHAGFGNAAGVASKTTTSIRRKVHQIWLQSPHSPSLQCFVGDVDARKDLQRYVEGLRRILCVEERDHHRISLPPDLVELSYLVYDDEGACYEKHVDAFTKNNQRSVSFLIYLGGSSSDDDDDDDDELWDTSVHGGALRIHGAENAQHTGCKIIVTTKLEKEEEDGSSFYSDVPPNPGTLVLFDSTTVPHEVRPVYRKRVCVVGWFGSRVEDELTK